MFHLLVFVIFDLPPTLCCTSQNNVRPKKLVIFYFFHPCSSHRRIPLCGCNSGWNKNQPYATYHCFSCFVLQSILKDCMHNMCVRLSVVCTTTSTVIVDCSSSCCCCCCSIYYHQVKIWTLK